MKAGFDMGKRVKEKAAKKKEQKELRKRLLNKLNTETDTSNDNIIDFDFTRFSDNDSCSKTYDLKSFSYCIYSR